MLCNIEASVPWLVKLTLTVEPAFTLISLVSYAMSAMVLPIAFTVNSTVFGASAGAAVSVVAAVLSAVLFELESPQA